MLRSSIWSMWQVTQLFVPEGFLVGSVRQSNSGPFLHRSTLCLLLTEMGDHQLDLVVGDLLRQGFLDGFEAFGA